MTLAALLVTSTLLAQLGEVRFGVVGSYGTGDAYRAGAGVVLGVAAGRLAYLGLRWTYYHGVTRGGVTNRAQVFATELGILVPTGPVDIVPGLTLGAVRFAQRAPGVAEHSTEFLAAPGLSVEVRVAPVTLIPEVQYHLAGDPDLPTPVEHRGLVASLRVVIPLEIGRIRR